MRWANFVWKTAPLLLAAWVLATYALSHRSSSDGGPDVRVHATFVNVGQSFVTIACDTRPAEPSMSSTRSL